MGQFSDFSHFFRPARPEVLPTAREIAEQWIRTLRGADPVELAEAEAEVEFRRKERTGNWRDSTGTADFVPEPAHWLAGAEYTRRMFVGYGQAAFRHIQKPRDFERFLHETIAILSDDTYRQKLRPYDDVAGADAEGRAFARFRELVRTAASGDLARLVYAAWERHQNRCQQKLHGPAGIEQGAPDVGPSGRNAVSDKGSPVVLTAEPPAAEATNPEPDGPAIAEARDARLQEFVREHNTTIAAVYRAARVAKTDMQRWRKCQLKSTSVMSLRIEAVLSGKTPFPPETKG